VTKEAKLHLQEREEVMLFIIIIILVK